MKIKLAVHYGVDGHLQKQVIQSEIQLRQCMIIYLDQTRKYLKKI